MASGSFYVYALFDPRDSRAKPFYIGKGSGSRAYAHLSEEGQGRKNRQILQIQDSGNDVVVRQLVSDLSEPDALKIEAQLISAHGTVDTGGPLLNKVVPTGIRKSSSIRINIPAGVTEKAQIGLSLLKESILELIAANDNGIRNADAVSHLGLHSDHDGNQKNYLSYSILGILMREGSVRKVAGNSRNQTRYEYVKIGETGTA